MCVCENTMEIIDNWTGNTRQSGYNIKFILKWFLNMRWGSERGVVQA